MDVKLIATKLNELGEEVEIGTLREFNTVEEAKEYIIDHMQIIADDPEIYAVYISNKKRRINMTELKHIDIYTDGACSGNPGKGGWGAILKYKNITKEISGSDSDTTNNRMELTAVIRALQKLKYACEVTVYTDSMYVSNAFKKGWFWQWKKNNWRRTGNKEILNKDLWEELDKLLKIHKVTFEWVKGHAGHPENEKCDKLATTAIKNIA